MVSGSNLTKVDRGTLVLSGANTNTGNTVVNGGTVQGNTDELARQHRVRHQRG